MSNTKDIGQVDVMQLDGEWLISIIVNGQAFDLDTPFDSPGVAVDHAMKWAAQRGLILTWPFMKVRQLIIGDGS